MVLVESELVGGVPLLTEPDMPPDIESPEPDVDDPLPYGLAMVIENCVNGLSELPVSEFVPLAVTVNWWLPYESEA